MQRKKRRATLPVRPQKKRAKRRVVKNKVRGPRSTVRKAKAKAKAKKPKRRVAKRSQPKRRVAKRSQPKRRVAKRSKPKRRVAKRSQPKRPKPKRKSPTRPGVTRTAPKRRGERAASVEGRARGERAASVEGRARKKPAVRKAKRAARGEGRAQVRKRALPAPKVRKRASPAPKRRAPVTRPSPKVRKRALPAPKVRKRASPAPKRRAPVTRPSPKVRKRARPSPKRRATRGALRRGSRSASSGIPLTRPEQIRLYKAEIDRLRLAGLREEVRKEAASPQLPTEGIFPTDVQVEDLREFVQGSIADVIDREERRRQGELRRKRPEPRIADAAPVEAREILKLCVEQQYDHRPVVNVRLLPNGWIVGADAWGRELRAIAILNTANGRLRIRWRDKAPLPKRGGYIEDDSYEALKPQRYAVFGVFA